MFVRLSPGYIKTKALFTVFLEIALGENYCRTFLVESVLKTVFVQN